MISTTLPRYSSKSGLAFYQTGMGLPLVLLHGVGLRAESWSRQLSGLANEQTLYAVDLPSHGHSEGLNGKEPSIALYADRVRAFVDEVVGAPVLVAGHSLGALTALDFASRHAERCLGVAALAAVFQRSPEASKAVRERAASLRDKSQTDVAAAPLLRWFGERPRGAAGQAAVACRHWLLAADRDAYAAGYQAFAEVAGPAPDRLRALSCPALFLAGEHDPNSTPVMAGDMAKLAPDGRAFMIAGARHMLQLTHPAAVNDALVQFFADCQKRASDDI